MTSTCFGAYIVSATAMFMVAQRRDSCCTHCSRTPRESVKECMKRNVIHAPTGRHHRNTSASHLISASEKLPDLQGRGCYSAVNAFMLGMLPTNWAATSKVTIPWPLLVLCALFRTLMVDFTLVSASDGTSLPTRLKMGHTNR